MKKTMYTMTADGPVAHVRHPLGFMMPVKLDLRPGAPSSVVSVLARPKYERKGILLYALPGGGEYRVLSC